jgi:receptor protein-tyrosine kinase
VHVVDVADLLAMLRRRWLAMAICILAGLSGALSVTRSTESSYRASARLFVNVSAARGVQEALQGVQLTTGLLASYAQVATSREAAQRIIDKLHLDMSAGALSGKLSAQPQGETLLVRVSATDHDPARAALLANTAADVFIDLIDDFESGRAERVEARVIDDATRPTAPIQPKPARNLALGGTLGLLAGLAVALLLESLDTTVKTPEQAATTTGRPLLAIVPKRKHPDELLTVESTGDPAAEAYRALRTAIRFLATEQPLRSIVVTSPASGEGKSLTAANLAVAFAESGARVVIVDADLRRPRLHSMFGVSGDVGVTSVLSGEVALRDAMQVWGPNLAVLPAGPLPPNPAELVGSEAMARMLTALDDDLAIDLLIVDAPAVLPVTDDVALSTQVSAVVMVVRAGKTRRDAAAEAIRRLDVVAPGQVIGCVLNALPRTGSVHYQQEYRYTA